MKTGLAPLERSASGDTVFRSSRTVATFAPSSMTRAVTDDDSSAFAAASSRAKFGRQLGLMPAGSPMASAIVGLIAVRAFLP